MNTLAEIIAFGGGNIIETLVTIFIVLLLVWLIVTVVRKF